MQILAPLMDFILEVEDYTNLSPKVSKGIIYEQIEQEAKSSF